MQAGMNELIYVKFEGPMADALIQLDPKIYNKYMIMERGKTEIYAALPKALYWTVRDYPLFWRRLTEKLEEWEYEINPYYWCVVNKTINRT